MYRTTVNRLSATLAATAAMLVVGQALAAVSGTASGTLKFFEHEGNYCPTSRSCTGAKYLQSAYDNTSGSALSRVKVYIEDSAGTIYGQSTTTTSGSFSIAYTNAPTSARLVIHHEHADGRFHIVDSAGAQFKQSWSVTLSSGTTSIGTKMCGSSGSPNALCNLYNGAYRVWNNVLKNSSLLVTTFPDVTIYAYDPASCPTSCAWDHYIIIDSEGSAYSPQHRIQHEMGHIASAHASYGQNFSFSGKYDYNGSGGWNLESDEYGSIVFEEALATTFSDMALYGPTATAPHTCLSSSACSTNGYNIETSGGTGCTARNRKPIEAIRYFWDNYDSVVDYTGENLARTVGDLVSGVYGFANGTSNQQKDEPWSADYSYVDSPDGRSVVDFRNIWYSMGIASSTQWLNNCSPVGD